ncbi:MAG: gliding motility-associated C-terminal domain-containing protein [Chitinophagaceae bacterium]
MSFPYRALIGFLLSLLYAIPGHSQTCNNWLSLPSYQSYVSVGDLDVPGDKITVEAVFMRTAPYSGGDIWAGDLVSKHNNPPDINYLLRPGTAEITTSNNGYVKTPDICPIELNRIYHVAMVYDGASLKFYRNGFLMSSVAASGTLFQNNFNTRIGLYDALVHNTQLIGYINEVRIWNIARTQSQIRAYMNTSLPNPTTQTGLQAYYTFDNLLNKQGNPAWNGVLGGSAQINQTNNISCTFVADSCPQATPPVHADFDIPSSVCVNTPVTIANTSQNASSYYWNFCVADINQAPIGQNLGNPGGNLSQPVFMDYVLYNNNYYGFVINHYPGKLIRLDYGNSLLNTPVSHDLGNFGGIIPPGYGSEGIQVVQNEGKWYAIIVGGYVPSGSTPRVLKVEFGADLANLNPTATNWGNIGGLNSPHDLHVFRENNNWYGLTVNAYDNSVTRFSFTNSFDNTPTGVNIGGFGLLSYPDGVFAINDNGFWRVFVTNNNANSRLVRLDFGSSLLNTPTAVSVANVGNTDGLRDLTLIKYCDQVVGFGVNGTNHNLYRLNFPDLGSAPVVTNLGNVGNLLIPHSISKLFRVNDDLYTFITNVGNNTITRLRFPGCANANVPNSTLQNPPTIIYNTPGIYNINLTVDDGLPTQASICKQIEVTPGLPHRPLQLIEICKGESIRLGSNTAHATYAWNNGAATDSIDVNAEGYYWVETSLGGCSSRDSFLISHYDGQADFSYRQDVCDPLTLQMSASNAATATTYYWDFGDGSFLTGVKNTVHSYASTGNYMVRYAAGNGTCADTVSKLVSIDVSREDFITTSDTTICFGQQLPLKTLNTLSSCWTPAINIDDPLLASPTVSPVSDITYFVTSEVTGSNLIRNGDFTQGNTGFVSGYVLSDPNSTEGQYFIGNNPRTWNNSMNSCTDHTSGNGNMMMVNGSPVAGVTVWKQTVAVSSNTNYAFSTWVQSLVSQNPARLQFSINGKIIGNPITAVAQACDWSQFYTTWNSGSATSAEIAIVNNNAVIQGNDFALDDISFAPVFIKQDSIKIIVEKPVVTASADTIICAGRPVQLEAAGAQDYSWLPGIALNDGTLSDPIANPTISTEYIVTGTTANGCIAKDTVQVDVFAKPSIDIHTDTSICKNTSLPLWVNGGISYAWSPSATLDDPSSANPVASPASSTSYQVVITDANTCEYLDSVRVDILPDPVFSVSSPVQICLDDSIVLTASGGDSYSWSPSNGLNTPAIEVSPAATTDYEVTITESICGNSTTLQTRVTVLPLPVISATSSNDIDCSYDRSRLDATGARTYNWTPSATLSNASIHNPVAMPRETTIYVVAGTDRSGCTGYDSITVKVDDSNKGGYLMPSAFTPNNDGLNDCYGIKFWGIIDNIEFSVFDRWGVRVFYSKERDACWDGTYKGEKQPAGVYVYMIKASTNCANPVFRKGTFVLVR